MFNCVIFDMDGLMFDTEKYYRVAMIQSFEEFGLYPDIEKFDQTTGMNMPDTRAVFNLIEGYAQVEAGLWKRIDELMDELYEKQGVPFKPGLLELLNYLKEHGFTIGLATSTNQNTAEKLLKAADVYSYFSGLVFGDMVKHGKPAPDIYMLAADTLDMQPERCLVLEDSCAGVRSASLAGMSVAMVPDTIQPTDDIRRLAYGVYDSLWDVIPILEQTKIVALKG